MPAAKDPPPTPGSASEPKCENAPLEEVPPIAIETGSGDIERKDIALSFAAELMANVSGRRKARIYLVFIISWRIWICKFP